MKHATECDWCRIATNDLHPAATDITITKEQTSFTPVWLCTVCLARYDQQEATRMAAATPGSGNYPIAITFRDGMWHMTAQGRELGTLPAVPEQ